MRAHADVAEGKVVLTTTLGHEEPGNTFSDMVERSKAVPGARWSKKAKHWRYPLAVETCHALRRVWGDDLTIGHELGAWYRQEAAGRAVQAARASQSDAQLTRLPEVAPALFSTLRPDQRVGVAWVAQGYRGSGLLADQPGLGKTLETIGGILEAGGGDILIVCPKLSVKRVWQREWNRWAPDVPVYAARGTRARRQKVIDAFDKDPSETRVLIVVAEMLRVIEEPDPTDFSGKKMQIVGQQYPELFTPWDWVAVDESHRSFGSLTIVKGNLAGKGLKALGKMADRRLAITGTPFGRGGRVQGMFGTLHWLWPDEFTSFWRWAGGMFKIEEEEIYIKGGGGRTRMTKRIGELKGSLDEFFDTLGPRILRRTKAEVLPNLPPKQFVEVLCEMEGEQLKQYRQMSDEAEVVVPGGMIIANGVLAELTRAKQIANGALHKDSAGNVRFNSAAGGSCKLENLLQMLDQRGILDGDSELKVIVASQFNEFLSALEQRLEVAGVGYHIITGKTSDTKRDKAMEEFQNEGGHQVFLLNSKAGGVSVTLDAADEVHCLDELYNPEDQEQLEDRAHRASRNHQVTIYHYRSEGTIDEQIATNVEGKRQAQHAIMDGRRGLEYARELIRYRKPAE